MCALCKEYMIYTQTKCPFCFKSQFLCLSCMLVFFLFSAPSHASTASLSDRQSHQKDTTSVASSRASIIPTYDDVSLNQRNAAANKAERNGVNQSTGPPRRSSRSSHLSLDSQEKSVDQGGQFYDFYPKTPETGWT